MSFSHFLAARRPVKRLKLIETAYDEMTDPAGLSVAEIERVQQPILAVYGGLSARKRSGFALQRSAPRCELQLVPDVGHFFPLTRPGLFARPALSFLRSVVGDKPSASHHAADSPAHVVAPERPPVPEAAP